MHAFHHRRVAIVPLLFLLLALGVLARQLYLPRAAAGWTDVAAWAPAGGTGPGTRGRQTGSSLITDRDTIDGQDISDRDVIERIEQIASRIPLRLLEGHRPGRGVQYLAHAFSGDDVAAVSLGVFRDPAAALAFGCALDPHLAGRCELTPVDSGLPAYEGSSGERCTPMGLAVGAPVYEPDRCEAIGTVH